MTGSSGASLSIEPRDAGYELHTKQVIDQPIEPVFEFFSNPDNLQLLTPDRMKFEIVECEDNPLREESLIKYNLQVLFVPITWVSRITEWSPPDKFCDVMKQGPFQTWKHTHTFESIDEQSTRVQDHVFYELPLGFLGDLAHPILVKPDLQSIFDYRHRQLQEQF